MDANAPHKRRAIVYGRRDSTPRIEYQVISPSGVIRTCAPRAWHALPLPDATTPERLEAVAELRYRAKRTQLRDVVDDNAWLRANEPADGRRYVALCAHVGIVV